MTLVAVTAARVLGQAGEIGGDLSPFRSCGLNCLFVVAKLNDVPVSLEALRKALAPREDGESSIADIERAASALGMHVVSIKADMASLADVKLPAIVHLKSRSPQSGSSHYVVLAGLHRQGVMTIDAPKGLTIHPYDEFAKDWSGAAITFSADRDRQGELLTQHVASNDRLRWPKILAVAASCLIASLVVYFGRRRMRRETSPSEIQVK